MKLLVTGAWSDGKNHINELEAMGHTVVFQQQESGPLVCPAQEVEGVICNGLFLYHPIEEFASLKYIQLTSAGYDRVPLDMIRQRKIEIHNAGDVYSTPMAEFAVGGVLQLYKKFDTFRQNQKLHRWEKRRDLLELSGKTVCIIGCGSVGKACAKRFAAFDAKVVGVNRTVAPMEYFDQVVPLEQLDEVVPESDIVVLAIALTEETNGLLNRDRLSMLKEDAIIVNIARGGIVDTKALIEILKSKSGIGAVLDVFDEEPLQPEALLWDIGNVIITPHNSFIGENRRNELKKIIFKNISSVDNRETDLGQARERK